MNPRPKTAYHPHLLIAFYLNFLPADLLQHIPRSTRHEWTHKDQAALYGYDWHLSNKHLFDTLRMVATNKRLLQINKALLHVIALKRFITRHHASIQQNIPKVQDVVLNNIHKITAIIGLRTTLKYLQQPYSWYVQLRRKQKCHSSLLSLCNVKHPAQLISKEINVIKAYCTDTRYLLWPLISVYHQILRDKAAFFNSSTFYKYVSLLELKRKSVRHRRKNHHTGIRAHAPLQILHVDATVFRTADKRKNYIHLIQDNFSRAILSYRVAAECTAKNTFENLDTVLKQFLIPANITSCTILTDDGPENAGAIKKLQLNTDLFDFRHLIAQRDVEFSNSMIESVNKQLKYRFLYHHHIPDYQVLLKYIEQAIKEFNNRPHNVLNGLTPLEVLAGKAFDKVSQKFTTPASLQISN